jgi:hypothetical protein
VLAPIGPQTLPEGGSLTFTVAATGQPGQALRFSLDPGAPEGAAIDPVSGVFTWTPAGYLGQGPGSYAVTVRVTANGSAALSAAETVAVTVTAVADPGVGQAGWAAVASALTHSAEYYANFIAAAYQRYLGRGPDGPGLAAWVGAMQQGLTDEQLEAHFIGSDEYIALHGGASAGWVAGMYRDLLGRTPAPAEVAGWVSALADGLAPTAVAYGFAASAEREGQRVGDDYRRFLGRSPSQAEASGWVNGFLGGLVNEDVTAGFVGSPEHFYQHGGNVRDWLFAAYQDVLGRAPDRDGYDHWLGVLEGGM